MKTVSKNVIPYRFSNSRKWFFLIIIWILLISLTAAVVPKDRQNFSNPPNLSGQSATPTPKAPPISTSNFTSIVRHEKVPDTLKENAEIVIPSKYLNIPQQPLTIPRIPQQTFRMPDMPNTSSNPLSSYSIPSLADTYRFSPLTTFTMPDFPDRYIPPTTYTMPSFPDRYIPPTTYTMPSFPNRYIPPTTYTMPSFPNRYIPPTTYTMPSFPRMPSFPSMPSMPLR